MITNAKNLQDTLDRNDPLVGARLVEFREKAGLSIQDMVDRTGLSRSGIEKMERDPDCSPTVRSIEGYVQACGRTLGEFFKPWTRVKRTREPRSRELAGARR